MYIETNALSVPRDHCSGHWSFSYVQYDRFAHLIYNRVAFRHGLLLSIHYSRRCCSGYHSE
jgi:hypothetical protein